MKLLFLFLFTMLLACTVSGLDLDRPRRRRKPLIRRAKLAKLKKLYRRRKRLRRLGQQRLRPNFNAIMEPPPMDESPTPMEEEGMEEYDFNTPYPNHRHAMLNLKPFGPLAKKSLVKPSESDDDDDDDDDDDTSTQQQTPQARPASFHPPHLGFNGRPDMYQPSPYPSLKTVQDQCCNSWKDVPYWHAPQIADRFDEWPPEWAPMDKQTTQPDLPSEPLLGAENASGSASTASGSASTASGSASTASGSASNSASGSASESQSSGSESTSTSTSTSESQSSGSSDSSENPSSFTTYTKLKKPKHMQEPVKCRVCPQMVCDDYGWCHPIKLPSTSPKPPCHKCPCAGDKDFVKSKTCCPCNGGAPAASGSQSGSTASGSQSGSTASGSASKDLYSSGFFDKDADLSLPCCPTKAHPKMHYSVREEAGELTPAIEEISKRDPMGLVPNPPIPDLTPSERLKKELMI